MACKYFKWTKKQKPKISGTPPGPRYSHSAILAGSRIIIFGGKGEKVFFLIFKQKPGKNIQRPSRVGSRYNDLVSRPRGFGFSVRPIRAQCKSGRRQQNAHLRWLERSRILQRRIFTGFRSNGMDFPHLFRFFFYLHNPLGPQPVSRYGHTAI